MNAKLNEMIINLRREFEKVISVNKLPLMLSSNTLIDDSEASFGILGKDDEVYCIFDIYYLDGKNGNILDMAFQIMRKNPMEMQQYAIIAVLMVCEGLSFSKANEKATEFVSAMNAKRKKIICMANYTYDISSEVRVLIRSYVKREKYVYENDFIDVPATITGIVLGVHYTDFSQNIYTVKDELGDNYAVYAHKAVYGDRIKLLNKYTFCGIVTSSYVDDVVGGLQLQYIKNDYEESSSALNKTSFNEMNGREFELYTERLLKANGFDDVEVTKASGDFGVDVIAFKDEVKYAIQCKRYSGAVGIEAVQEIIAAKSMNSCHVAVVLTNSRFTDAAVTLARANGVLLWDGNKLTKMAENINGY